MKENSDEAIALINNMTLPPKGTSASMVKLLENLGSIIKDVDKENLKLSKENIRLRREVQMLRAVLEQERDRVC